MREDKGMVKIPHHLPLNVVGISRDGLSRGISCILVAAGDSSAPRAVAMSRTAASRRSRPVVTGLLEDEEDGFAVWRARAALDLRGQEARMGNSSGVK